MEKIKRKNVILTGLLAFVMVFSVMFGLTACDKNNGNGTGSESFECSGNTFVYDSWESTGPVSEGERLIISGEILESYAKTHFVFNAEGTFVWENTENHNITWQGNWEISGTNLVLTINSDGDQEVLPIVGTKFYVTQPMSEENSLHIFFKLG